MSDCSSPSLAERSLESREEGEFILLRLRLILMLLVAPAAVEFLNAFVEMV